MRNWLTVLLVVLIVVAKAQTIAPINDDLTNAINIANVDAYCSANTAFNNIDATPSSYRAPLDWPAVGNDVWFKFTAIKFDVTITVTGKLNAASPNTLLNPLVALYTLDPITNGITQVPASPLLSNNVNTIYKGGLTIGTTYYIRVSARENNVGSFQLCVNNYFPPLQAGQDCGTVSFLCSMEKFTQSNVTGAGLKNTETAGTCLGTESNSAWYMWTAAKSGDFTFLITPTVTDNDIDWVLYDLGVGGDCSKAVAANAIRCASGSGVTCSPSYYVTGLSLTETDLREESGCVAGQNGLVKYVDMIEGHNYALIVDNFSRGSNGFQIEFGGTTAFVGPTSEIKLEKIAPCTPEQSFKFTSLAKNYNSIKWTFGEGASISSATTDGPFEITYSTPGDKVAVLEAKTLGGCDVVSTVSFTVTNKPVKPPINASKLLLCVGDVLQLTTDAAQSATYHWAGPNGFTATTQNASIPITGAENEGDYTLYTQVGDCKSEITTLTIGKIDPMPVSSFKLTAFNACETDQYFIIVNQSTNYSNLVWDYGADATVKTMPNGEIQLTYSTNGTKTIKLTATTPNGCTATYSQQIDVQLKPLKPVIVANKPAFCLGDVIKLQVAQVPNVTYQWTGPGNFTANTSAIEIPVNSKALAGEYTTTLKIGNCVSDMASFIVPPIANVPKASFETTPTFKFKFSAPLEIEFFNKSIDADTYLWNFGDGFTSTEINPKHTFNTVGTYQIALTAMADEGCANTMVKGDLIILSSGTLFIPNTFSPNGDGINDEFVVSITNLKSYQLNIFNRFGNKVFQTFSIFENWNGTHKNQNLPVGVYYYQVLAKTVANIDVKYSGSLTLIR